MLKQTKEVSSLVLLTGESTHTHTLYGQADGNIGVLELDIEKNKELANVVLPPDTRPLYLKKGGVLRHEEHDTIVIPQGYCVSFRQQEFNPFTRGWSSVFD